jgi:methylated-DNA-[protein]-cysteine S-methyltransferase
MEQMLLWVGRYLVDCKLLGSVGIVWSDFLGLGHPLILRIIFSESRLSAEHQMKDLYPLSISKSCIEIKKIARSIKAFLEGKDVSFSLDTVALEVCSSFQKKVLCATYQIPRGHVSTYQKIAKEVGSKDSVRAVGNALARNPFPIIIPCHRVISSDGSLGGFQGGVKMKRFLLEQEGYDSHTFKQ